MQVGAPMFLDASGWSSEIPMTHQSHTSIATGPPTMHFGARLTKATSQEPTKSQAKVTEK